MEYISKISIYPSWSKLLVFAAALLAFGGQAVPGSAKEAYVIGVVPQQPPVTMYTNWMPFIERLMKETGEDIKLKVYETMSDFESDYNRGVPDLIFANPTQTVIAHRSQGYVPLVRSSKRIAGIVFVRNDSNIKSLTDLENKDVAFVGSRNV
ncbi:MAG: hypothetical protein A2078_13185 [Nitrospirae bacterium GWC2_57_9]|nr:MAG: hypothetical protein A2078_13185 [Nitrospirae bacterium GWC2_57_9]